MSDGGYFIMLDAYIDLSPFRAGSIETKDLL